LTSSWQLDADMGTFDAQQDYNVRTQREFLERYSSVYRDAYTKAWTKAKGQDDQHGVILPTSSLETKETS